MVELDAGREVTALLAYRSVLPRLKTILGVVLVAAVVIAVVDLTTIGLILGVWFVVRWSLLAQVVVLENASGRRALQRSGRLVRGNWWRVGSLLLFVTVIALLLGPLCGTLLLFATSASFNFINFVAGVVYAVFLPFAAIATTYLYFDLAVAEELEREGAETDDVLPAEAALGHRA
jgi:small-conductance mechanosensitive channel